MNSVRALGICLLILMAVASQQASADPQSKSFSSWQLGTQVQGSYTIMAREVTRLPAYQYNANLSEVLIQHLSEKISLSGDGQPCIADHISPTRASEGYLKIRITYQCPPNSQNIEISNHAIFNVAASHIHFAKISVGEGETSERLYTRRQLSHQFSLLDTLSGSNPQNPLTIFSTYTEFGFEHILIGLDHIAFLLALILLASRLSNIIFIVTGFTLGHSITLSLTVLGIVTPDIMVVEAFIGFTIALIAAENIAVRSSGNLSNNSNFSSSNSSSNNRAIASIAGISILLAALLSLFADIGPSALSLFGLALFAYCYLLLSDSERRARQLRPGITLLFGLIHGFGFASVLIEVGLPERSLIPALVGFNVGVELGQIAIVCVFATLGFWLLKHFDKYRQISTELISAALCGLGIYWFIQRLYF